MSDVQPLMKDNFKSLFWDKLKIMNRLKSNTDLVKCLLSNDPAFKTYSPAQDEIDGLDFSHIYPCPYTIGTNQEAKSIITMTFSYRKSATSQFWKNGYISICCYCHKDLVQTKYGILRYDFMLQRVNDVLFNTRESTWVGKLGFSEMDDIVMAGNTDYIGTMITYTSTENM